VLSLDQVGTHDNFFDLGGHSLAATMVISQVIKHFQLELPLTSLFQSPTVAEMAAIITEHQGKQLAEAELEHMLGELESMSDDEAQQLVAKATVKR
jgi:acyl carrier protein